MSGGVIGNSWRLHEPRMFRHRLADGSIAGAEESGGRKGGDSWNRKQAVGISIQPASRQGGGSPCRRDAPSDGERDEVGVPKGSSWEGSPCSVCGHDGFEDETNRACFRRSCGVWAGYRDSRGSPVGKDFGASRDRRGEARSKAGRLVEISRTAGHVVFKRNRRSNVQYLLTRHTRLQYMHCNGAGGSTCRP